jgi:hypothetical protein
VPVSADYGGMNRASRVEVQVVLGPADQGDVETASGPQVEVWRTCWLCPHSSSATQSPHSSWS